MNIEKPNQNKSPQESERIEDVEKAMDMAYGGSRDRARAAEIRQGAGSVDVSDFHDREAERKEELVGLLYDLKQASVRANAPGASEEDKRRSAELYRTVDERMGNKS